jgi:hypothetical protein
LPGDFFDTGVVTSKDVTAIKSEATGKHGATPTIFGAITGDGTVSSIDYKAARRFLGTRLPTLGKTGGKRPKVALARLSPFAPRKVDDALSGSEHRHTLVSQPGGLSSDRNCNHNSI